MSNVELENAYEFPVFLTVLELEAQKLYGQESDSKLF